MLHTGRKTTRSVKKNKNLFFQHEKRQICYECHMKKINNYY